jgi:hypothetical protein
MSSARLSKPGWDDRTAAAAAVVVEEDDRARVTVVLMSE